MKIHHIGYLVKKIEQAKCASIGLGFSLISDTIYDVDRKINICFLEKDGYVVELVSPVEKDSIVSGIMKQYKNSPYHLCYESDDLEKDAQSLANSGYVQINDFCNAVALGNRRIAFFMNSNIGMIEMVEGRRENG